MGMFKGYAEQLVKEGKAYYCFCDKERLDEMRLVQKASGQAPHYDGHCRSLSPQEVQAKLDARPSLRHPPENAQNRHHQL